MHGFTSFTALALVSCTLACVEPMPPPTSPDTPKEGGWFCCNAAGTCVHLPPGTDKQSCKSPNTLQWCEKMKTDPATGTKSCEKWGER